MSKLVDEHQARRDAAMLAQRAEDASCGSEGDQNHTAVVRREHSAEPSEANLSRPSMVPGAGTP